MLMLLMSPTHRAAYDLERRLARERVGDGRLDEAIAHLERAHVLGQAFLWAHLATHAAMFAIAVRRRDGADALGQAARMALGVVGNLVGRLPAGNPGSTRVSMFAPMPVPDDLRAAMDATSTQ